MHAARDDALTAEFEALEHAWADAVMRQDRAALERFLAPDYALVVSAAPDQPVARDAWLAQAVGPYRTSTSALSGCTPGCSPTGWSP